MGSVKSEVEEGEQATSPAEPTPAKRTVRIKRGMLDIEANAPSTGQQVPYPLPTLGAYRRRQDSRLSLAPEFSAFSVEMRRKAVEFSQEHLRVESPGPDAGLRIEPCTDQIFGTPFIQHLVTRHDVRLIRQRRLKGDRRVLTTTLDLWLLTDAINRTSMQWAYVKGLDPRQLAQFASMLEAVCHVLHHELPGAMARGPDDRVWSLITKVSLVEFLKGGKAMEVYNLLCRIPETFVQLRQLSYALLWTYRSYLVMLIAIAQGSCSPEDKVYLRAVLDHFVNRLKE